MYLNWMHHYLPTYFGYTSFIFNPIFIYLIMTETRTATIGKYRYLLLCFALFDMTYSAIDLLVPIAFHVAKGGIIIFISDGPFFNNEEYGELALMTRSTVVGLSYVILIIHFIYRYIVLYSPRLTKAFFKPIGVHCTISFFVLHGIVWFVVSSNTFYSDSEIRNHIYEDFMETFNVDSRKLSFLVGMYAEVSPPVIERYWWGAILLTVFSSYAISIYFFLGYKIMKKLKHSQEFSPQTRALHNKLLTALAVQTFIPICISFLPCLLVWYSPMIGVNLEDWNNYVGVVALSTFPTLDPIAVSLLLPLYRMRVINFFAVCFRKVTNKSADSSTDQSISAINLPSFVPNT